MTGKTLFAAGLLAALAAAPNPSAAAGNGYWDFRFSVGGEPKVSEAEYDFDDGTPDFDQSWDAPGASLEFNVAHRFASRSASSGVITFGAFVRGFDGEDNFGSTLEIGILGFQVGGGYSYRPNQLYSLEVGPNMGIGFGGATESFPGSEDLESDEGAYFRLGVAAANLFNFGKFQLGVTLGVASWAAVQRYDPQTINTTGGPVFFPGADVTYSGGGGFANISMGFR